MIAKAYTIECDVVGCSKSVVAPDREGFVLPGWLILAGDGEHFFDQDRLKYKCICPEHITLRRTVEAP